MQNAVARIDRIAAYNGKAAACERAALLVTQEKLRPLYREIAHDLEILDTLDR
jgi:hypothetical protein